MSKYRQQQASANTSYDTEPASATESDFSVGSDESDYVRNWDIARVCEWLRSVNGGQYVDIFKKNHITGANLIDLDSSTLKEMGIRRVGDRVRIASQAKKFRNTEYLRKRESIRVGRLYDITDINEAYIPQVSAVNDHPVVTPPSSGSPRTTKEALRTDKNHYNSLRAGSRPVSPLHVIDQGRTTSRATMLSPREVAIREQTNTYFQPLGAPSEPLTARSSTNFVPITTKSARSVHSAGHRRTTTLVVDTDVANGIPKDKPWIRAIFDNARSSIVFVGECRSAEDIILATLRQGRLNESHYKSYCFWVLEGTDPMPARCRRISESELLRISSDGNRLERERLLIRKIHAGEPEGGQLESAVTYALAQQQQQQAPASALHTASRSQLGVKSNSESLPPLSYPMSPASAAERERHLEETTMGLESGQPIIRPRVRKHQELHGERPDSRYVMQDPTQYFPDVDAQKIEQVRRMSMRRSQRLSRATSRLSVMSNLSFGSVSDDAPPVPRIPENALLIQRNLASKQRPLSVYRDSRLDPLDENEESPGDNEPDRKSYISLADDGFSDDGEDGHVNITDPEGNTIRHFSDSSSVAEDQNSLNAQLSQVIEEDGEEEDEQLTSFLKPDAWENIPYMRGKLIGQGSFGSVYLALHATTAEIMAVKQVELPSTEGTAADAKKNTMVEALKREIGLLRELKHKNIVQYLGSSSESETLNIFLEYVPGGSITKMLADWGHLNETIIRKYVGQILVGLAFLHSKDIIHRDIKGANILIDTKGTVKISDFGISKRVQDSKTLLSETGTGGARRGRGLAANRVSLQGSVFWMAPEVVKQTAYTRKADIWSLGCLIVEMLTGSHPHPDLSQLQAIFKIGGTAADPSPTVPDNCSREAKEFLKQTFRIEHEERPEAQQLLATPFGKLLEV